MVYLDKMLFPRETCGPLRMGLLRLMLAGLSTVKILLWEGLRPIPKS